MKIALISDIHGNLPALKAVLKDCQDRQIDQIICLGDLVDFSPWTNEVIELIRTYRITTVMGNHDERIAYDLPIVDMPGKSKEETIARRAAIAYTRRTILPSCKEFLKNLPRNLILEYANKRIFFTHASPRQIDEYVYENDEDLQDRCLELTHADILFIGHTHRPYIKQRKNGLIVNVGSVGKTKEIVRKTAVYAIMEIKGTGFPFIKIIRIPYPFEETVRAIHDSEIPDFYADQL